VINNTIILLIHYYDPEERNHPLLKNIIKNWCGIYLPFNLYFGEPLQKIFSKAIIYDYLKREAEIGIRAVNEEIIDLVKKERPKYALWAAWQYDVLPSTLAAIRKEGTIVVGCFFDDEWRFDNYSKWWVPYLDYCVSHSIDAVPRYRELGARAIHAPLNTGIVVDVDWSNLKERYDISFVGSRIVGRDQWINELKKRNIPVHVFGEGWGGKGYISFEEMQDIFKSSKINLNFSGTYFRTLGIKGRIFEVCLAGGFLLTEYVPGLENYFEIDKEIVCFRNNDELIDKIGYYLSHDEERRAIAQAGWQRATGEYTSFHTVARVFSQIEQDLMTRGEKNEYRPPKLKMPFLARMIPSQYHFQWARTLMEESYQGGLWKDSLALSLSYNPFNIWAWYYRVVSFLPSFIRPALFRLYSATEKLPRALYYGLGSVPYLKKILQQSLVKKVILYLRM